jgi:hydroxymethylglutaryl-CoA reductase
LMCAANVVGGDRIRERAKRCLAICGIRDAEEYLFELC